MYSVTNPFDYSFSYLATSYQQQNICVKTKVVSEFLWNNCICVVFLFLSFMSSSLGGLDALKKGQMAVWVAGDKVHHIFYCLFTNITDLWFPHQKDVTLQPLGQLSEIITRSAKFSWKDSHIFILKDDKLCTTTFSGN